MGRTTDAERLKLDNALVDFLFAHKGRENSVSAKEITDMLQRTTTTDFKYETNISGYIRRIMLERRLPICHKLGGYYWAKTKEELIDSVKDLKMRMMSMQETVDHLESFLF